MQSKYRFSLFTKKGQRKYLNRQERLRFYAGTKSLPFEKMLFCQVLYFTGARISEVSELTIPQVDFADKTLIFRTLKRRRDDVFRQVPIPDHLLGQLKLLLENKSPVDQPETEQFIWSFSTRTGSRAIKDTMKAAKLFGLETFCMGRGSNLLVLDAGFDGLIIRLSSKPWRSIEVLGEGRVWVAAGVRLKELCGYAAKAGLTGFEFLEGIPGTVGGALRMNAGAMGKWMFDVVERVQLLDRLGTVRNLPKDAFTVEYRNVREISHGIALGAILKSADAEADVSIRERMDGYANLRRSSQPREPSAGCIFKNPEGNYAGKLIDMHGLKGMRVGGAEVSDLHGNFIVNRGNASAEDVIQLVRQVRAIIHARSGYKLIPEVLLLGQSWKTLLEEISSKDESSETK